MRHVYPGLLGLMLTSCGSSAPHTTLPSPHSLAAEESMLVIEAGSYRCGSTEAERNQAYDDALATAGSDGARKRQWFRREDPAKECELPTYLFDLHPVTQAAYSEFLQATNVPWPYISEQDWKKQGFNQDYQRHVKRLNWSSKSPPRGREDHPVVLVNWKHATAYCQWRGQRAGKSRRLPSASEFEKAARGAQGAIYPWGNRYEADKLNSAVRGPHDTTAVGSYPSGRSARGAEDVAGNVFHWTMTPWVHQKGRMTVKGSAWDDHGGLGRAAALHGRPKDIRHAIVGFRCAG